MQKPAKRRRPVTTRRSGGPPAWLWVVGGVAALALVAFLGRGRGIEGRYEVVRAHGTPAASVEVGKRLTITTGTMEWQGGSANPYTDLGGGRLRSGLAHVYAYEWRGGVLVLSEPSTGLVMELAPR